VRTTRDSHTSAKPIQRTGGIGSSRMKYPTLNCRIGVRYWINPIVESLTREAAAPKRISGIAVRIPKEIKTEASNTPEKIMIGVYIETIQS
jgi:hypothetical protein